MILTQEKFNEIISHFHNLKPILVVGDLGGIGLGYRRRHPRHHRATPLGILLPRMGRPQSERADGARTRAATRRTR